MAHWNVPSGSWRRPAVEHGVEHPVQMSVGMSDGERLWAVRYSSEHQSRTLFVSDRGETLRKLHPDNPRLQRFTDEDRVVVSEPPGDLPGVWLPIPESTALVIQPGDDEQQPFRPHRPSGDRVPIAAASRPLAFPHEGVHAIRAAP